MTARRAARSRRAPATPVAVDASIAVKWFTNEIGSDGAVRLLESEIPLVAPDLMPLEAANAWWKKVRRREMDVEDFDQAVVNLLAVGIVLDPTAPLLRRAARLAVDVGRTVYDAVYLVLSKEKALRLATADDGLRRAAVAIGVELWKP